MGKLENPTPCCGSRRLQKMEMMLPALRPECIKFKVGVWIKGSLIQLEVDDPLALPLNSNIKLPY